MNHKERWQISQISHGKNAEFHSLKWIHVIGWNSTKWLRVLTDRSNKHVRLSHHTAADICLWLQLSHRSSPSASSFWWWVEAGEDNQILQMFPGVFCFCEAQPWQSNRAGAATLEGDVLQAQALLPVPPLKPWSCASRSSRTSSSQHDPLGNSRAGRQLRKARTKGDTVAAHSLPCWAWHSRSGSAIFRATQCCHLIVATPQHTSLIENNH